MADDLFNASPDEVQMMMWSIMARLDDEQRARIEQLADATEEAGSPAVAELIRQALRDVTGLRG